MRGPKYDDMCKNVFQKTGCLLTTDGSEDRLAQPEGLPDYELSPVSILNPASTAPISNEINSSTGEKETGNLNIDYEDIEFLDNNEPCFKLSEEEALLLI